LTVADYGFMIKVLPWGRAFLLGIENLIWQLQPILFLVIHGNIDLN